MLDDAARKNVELLPTGSEAVNTIFDRISKARPEPRISVVNAMQAHAVERNGGINNDHD